MKQFLNMPSSLKFRHVLPVSGCCFTQALQKHELCWAKESFSQPKLYRQYFSSVIQANVIKPQLSLHRKHSSNNPLWPLPNVLMKMPKNDSEILICWGSLFDAHVILSAKGSDFFPLISQYGWLGEDWKTFTIAQAQYHVTWLRCGISELVSMTTLCVGFHWRIDVYIERCLMSDYLLNLCCWILKTYVLIWQNSDQIYFCIFTYVEFLKEVTFCHHWPSCSLNPNEISEEYPTWEWVWNEFLSWPHGRSLNNASSLHF